MISFLKTLSGLGWKTSIGPRAFLWAYSASLLLLILVSFLLSFVVTFTGLMLIRHTSQPAMAWMAALVAGKSVLSFGVLLWFLVQFFKLCYNRLHDFGLPGWYALAYTATVTAVSFGLTPLLPTEPLWGIVIAFFQILTVLLTYILAFEPGRNTPYLRAAAFDKPFGAFHKAIIATAITFMVLFSGYGLFSTIYVATNNL